MNSNQGAPLGGEKISKVMPFYVNSTKSFGSALASNDLDFSVIIDALQLIAFPYCVMV
jgi:hypothetical protein